MKMDELYLWIEALRKVFYDTYTEEGKAALNDFAGTWLMDLWAEYHRQYANQ